LPISIAAMSDEMESFWACSRDYPVGSVGNYRNIQIYNKLEKNILVQIYIRWILDLMRIRV